MKVKLQLFINGAYTFRSTVNLDECGADEEKLITEMFRGALHAIDSSSQYHLDITRRDAKKKKKKS